MLICLDTETSGLPRNWSAGWDVVDNWPRLVQLAWIVAEPSGQVVSQACHMIKPDGFRFHPKAVAVHGITEARARREGSPLPEVLAAFRTAIAGATDLIAHNLAFDENVLRAEYFRQGEPIDLDHFRRHCTMQAGTGICRLPGPRGYKWPTLGELHQHLFGQPLTRAHHALLDCQACLRCHLELVNRPESPRPNGGATRSRR
jgi:DNA polymerase III subunit epsilon